MCKLWILLALISVLLGMSCRADTDLSLWRNADATTRTAILSLARNAFVRYVQHHDVLDCPPNLPEALRQRGGVFISTMGTDGAPRCCMGTLYPLEPDIAHEIIANAVAAAGHDLRFRPLKPGDLSKLKLIVSFVGRPVPISDAEARSLDPVRDGLVVKNGDRFGVMLSGETPHVDLMLHWGRVRAGAGDRTPVQYFRISDVRFMEGL